MYSWNELQRNGPFSGTSVKSKKCVGFLFWLLLCALSLTPFFAQAV
ncbi:hypothetical protein GXP84_004226 [Salmonella enterica]|uniref:Uncharacterized protein n=1 Tax=Salmonella enterica TaxID=28901 RepID=A0A749C4Y7_SALER|nr:hypothetical protein [Salmonella enterica]EDR0791829.1 hypothetical protein [Salmonella enterica subsp. enterica serovar Rissen str. 150]EDR8340311.1 hypothetical protein [Salmonella enterica subsp. enterica serovar Tennessee]EDT2093934.1 hypothetical protein [Salmonella enterica subsp. enterica serovar Rissen]QDQ31300.1 RatA like protein [Salmonella enterica subsp. enterica serovar Typhimurium]